jgi:tRNA 2-thiouridine synthesizing protein C
VTGKTFLFVNRKAPYGSGTPAELRDAALMAASFDQQVHLAFLDDGVFQLVKRQQPTAIGQKHFAEEFLDLGEYDIDHVWVERQSLTDRGLTESDLLIPVLLIDRAEMAALMAKMDVVVSA